MNDATNPFCPEVLGSNRRTTNVICIQGSPSGCVRHEIPGATKVVEKGHERDSSSHSKFPYLLGGKLVKETATQEKFQMTTIVDIEHYYKMIMYAVRSRVSSNLIFASCVRYCDRAYYGFSMTLSRTLVLIEGNKS